MVNAFQFLDVILLNSALESRGEEQDGVVNWWLRVGVEDVHGGLLGFMEVRAVINPSWFSWLECYRWLMFSSFLMFS